MNSDEELIKTFYTSFQQHNWKGMLACYHEDVFFYDPAFENLECWQVKAMWEMLMSRASDLKISFDHISAADGYGSCDWVAAYTLATTGKKVVNKVKARFTFRDGKIIEHYDDFNLWRWSAQALGLPGLLFGWTPALHSKIRRLLRTSLDKFIAEKATR
jgi:ketosteroid isomerase-like protein